MKMTSINRAEYAFARRQWGECGAHQNCAIFMALKLI
jgi:hypothetical protein